MNYKTLGNMKHPKVVDFFVFLFDLDSMTSQRDPPRKISLTPASTTNQIVSKSADFVNKNTLVKWNFFE